VHGLRPEVADIFRSYAWPGNVRELRNVIERVMILEDGDVITPLICHGESRPRTRTQLWLGTRLLGGRTMSLALVSSRFPRTASCWTTWRCRSSGRRWSEVVEIKLALLSCWASHVTNSATG